MLATSSNPAGQITKLAKAPMTVILGFSYEHRGVVVPISGLVGILGIHERSLTGGYAEKLGLLATRPKTKRNLIVSSLSVVDKDDAPATDIQESRRLLCSSKQIRGPIL
jgi:hypothetical protein